MPFPARQVHGVVQIKHRYRELANGAIVLGASLRPVELQMVLRHVAAHVDEALAGGQLGFIWPQGPLSLIALGTGEVDVVVGVRQVQELGARPMVVKVHSRFPGPHLGLVCTAVCASETKIEPRA